MENFGEIILLIVFIAAALIAGFYLLNRYAYKKMSQQQAIIDQNKVTASIYIIDKKHQLAAEANLPKVVMANLPRLYKLRKSYFVKAKVGPQIATLMCEKKIFEQLQVKKTVKVDLAGIYIIGIKGAKTTATQTKKKTGLLSKAKSFFTSKQKD